MFLLISGDRDQGAVLQCLTCWSSVSLSGFPAPGLMVARAGRFSEAARTACTMGSKVPGRAWPS